MSEFLNALERGPVLADGGIGSMIFERTGRLSELNHCYEAFNLDNPELVRQIHLTYLQAGAQCLTTNTYEANRTHLEPLNELRRLREINRAGVRVAREAIEIFRQRTNIRTPFFILGSCGPTLTSRESPGGVREAYRAQIEAMMEENVDVILLETFSSLPHLMAVLEMLDGMTPHPPVIAQMTLHQREGKTPWDQDPVMFVRTVAELGANVAGVNALAPWEATAFVEAVADLPEVRERRIFLSARPNAGRVDLESHRFMTGINPEVMGRFARTVTDRGVRLVGGCTEVHPPFINEMYNYLQSRQTGRAPMMLAAIDLSRARTPAADAEKRGNGAFSRKLMDGEFAVSVEMLPARGTSVTALASKVEFVRELAESGLADALDLTDGSRGIPLLPPGDFIGILRDRLGWGPGRDRLEFIPHFTSRDLNVMGIQSRLMGYWGRGIHNAVFITGDPPKMSPTYPRSTAVYDLDSVAMIQYTHSCLNAGVDFGGEPLARQDDPRTHFTIGGGFEPEAVNHEHEMEKLRRKIEGGVDYIMTQPAFRYEPLGALESFRGQVSILIGVLILNSLEQAQRVGKVPGVVIPREIFARFEAFPKREDQEKVGMEIAAEQVRWVRSRGWDGLYLMSPATHRPVLQVLAEGLG